MEINFGDFYKGKRVLVTGHTGFKGSWLSIWLLRHGAEVIGVSLPPSSKRDNFVLSELKLKLDSYIYDIRDIEGLRIIINKVQPEIVFHMAAQPLVIESYLDPVKTFQTNIQGTVNLLEVCRGCNSVNEILVITTDKVYEDRDWLWGYRENDRLGGHDPYSASKAAAELAVNSYIKSFFNPKDYDKHGKVVATVRAGNVLGGGDWSKNRIIPDLYRAFEEGRQLKIRNPYATRPWQHVLDPLGAYLLLVSRLSTDPLRFSGAWNFGPDSKNVYSVKDLVEGVFAEIGSGSWSMEEDIKYKVKETNYLKLDTTKSSRLLGFNPLIGFKDMVRLTNDWYQDYSNSDVYDLCLAQISFWEAMYMNSYEQ